MPFNEELRKKLRILKEEYENGLLPEYIYGQLCKQTIDSYGDSAFEDLASLNPPCPGMLTKARVCEQILTLIFSIDYLEKISLEPRKYPNSDKSRRNNNHWMLPSMVIVMVMVMLTCMERTQRAIRTVGNSIAALIIADRTRE